MVKLQPWQWGVIALPILLSGGFLLAAAAVQIHAWGLNWIWGVFIVLMVSWRWLLVRWTRPAISALQSTVADMEGELTAAIEATEASSHDPGAGRQAAAELETILAAAHQDPPLWEDWNPFWQRCREVVTAVAGAYYPEVKYPLLNIYIPDAYGLIRGTVDDVDDWMHRLSPVLGQVSVGQAVQAYEVYRQLEPSARKLWQVWNWAQWLLNPVAAASRTLSQGSSNKATQELLGNLSHLLREVTLRNLFRQAIALYGGEAPPMPEIVARGKQSQSSTQTLQQILTQAQPAEQVTRQPVNLMLVGRTGAGKSSVINTLFQTDKAAVDVLPSTDEIRSYRWQADSGDVLTIWDTPGYEQVAQADFRQQVIAQAHQADLLLLVTPALDPALQMDSDLLQDMRRQVEDLAAIAIVTQVDRLRPLREWDPPYHWQGGNRPKEQSIRQAIEYRAEQLGSSCDRVLPLVTADRVKGREAWNTEALVSSLVELLEPTKQLRLARFLRDRETKTVAAARIIDRYTFQMTTTQGMTALLKSPVLQFLSTLTTGSPALAYVLAEQIPVEQLPVVIGKLQMAYDLFQLLATDTSKLDLLALWPLLLEHNNIPDRSAWAFGHGMVEYWVRGLTVDQLRERIDHYWGEYRDQG